MPNLKSMMKQRSHTDNNIKETESVSLNKIGRSSSITHDMSSCKSLLNRRTNAPTIQKCETVIGSLSVMAAGGTTSSATTPNERHSTYLWPDVSEPGGIMRQSQSSSRLGFLSRLSPSQRNLAMSRCSIGTCCKGPPSPTKARCGLSKTRSVAAALSRLPIVGSGLSSNRSSSALSTSSSQSSDIGAVMCKLCLGDVCLSSMYELQDCHCMFCRQCIVAYITFEIRNGSGEISCPDASCEQKGVISEEEMVGLVPQELISLYRRFRLIREVAVDSNRTFCPTMGCEGICNLPEGATPPVLLTCTLCGLQFCSACRSPWHPGMKCRKEDILPSPLEEKGVIKRCPVCGVPIERDAGCAQMMCRRCKHVFCWYCLTLLDDDFMLRHYDKGPCKNKLGHSRASVLWHRAQVVAVFFGLGVLVVIASPFMLAAAPVLLCCGPCLCKDKQEMEDTDSSSREGLHKLDEVDSEDP